MPVNEVLQGLADELKDLLNANVADDARLVQKGMMLYRQGLVTQLRFENGEYTAVVQDVSPAKVRLDPEFLGMSDCSCPGEELCRHQLAVFFAAYSKEASVSDWLAEWREPVRETKSVASWGLQAAKDLVKAAGLMKPDYDRWVQSFESSFDALVASKKHTNPYVVSELFGIHMKRVGASAPVEKEWRLLYELVASVVSFRKLLVLSEELGFEEHVVRKAYGHCFENLLEDSADFVERLVVQTMPFAFDEFIERLRDESHAVLTSAAGYDIERVYMHRMLWTELFRKKEWRQEEAIRIGARLKALEESENPLPFSAAMIHLYFLLGNDDLALKLAGGVPDVRFVPYMVYWIDYFTGAKLWRRVEPVIEMFLGRLKEYLDGLESYQSCSAFVRSVMRSIAPYCSENGRLDLYERALLVSLPYSFADYEYLLFERGDYDRWGELQAFVGLDFYDLPKDRVKVVEKERPEVLLGMLHQTAQKEIDQKNRGSYRAAVRHLKKLRTLYKKLKRVDDWEYFIEGLLERTKRLRAFHEECQRSKLI
ncbi:SWIM zinc finger family protein [Neobacillus rhizophilus]|uniref:SWIM zinc finger family protein n=1 Tax=Neobacillus rhizophilus TaxID=2833579 RepID=A0A942YU07_9BACI|nr:SWIM zinc finger family protein [Neobacillus rhizophilus]MBS4212669.1 SWIM zinc finger family protein [Neobacillus rhizophilus]